MQNSSAMCRAQEALHLERANASGLANVRSIATAAAAAWRAEAVLADQRESRHRLRAEALTAEERASSENPDRGFITAV